MTISICNDLAQLMTDFPELGVEGNPSRSKLINWSGGYTVYNGNRSMKFLTSTDGLDAIAAKDYITLTSYEEIFGLAAVLDSEGVELVAEVAGNAVKRAEYEAVYPTTPQLVEGEMVTNPRLFYVPFGYDASHLA